MSSQISQLSPVTSDVPPDKPPDWPPGGGKPDPDPLPPPPSNHVHGNSQIVLASGTGLQSTPDAVGTA